ncbi:MAG: efflux RND transporter periplasmic adaptor subunit [Paludibacteraceae bacterium]|nr:efflux RND transporter periplasmic adaptor subunit [Paludibacteraceae bacterium]
MKNSIYSILTVTLMLASCGNTTEEVKKTPARIKTELASTSTSVENTSYVGVVEEESSTAVSFTGSGTITQMHVTEGQRVSKGQLIAELDKTQSQNMLNAAEAQMQQANDALARMKQLHETNSLPEMKWVEVQSQVEQAKAQLDMAKKSLANCMLYAPVSGVIGKGVKSAGETALPAMSVATILNISTVKVKVSIPEKEIANIKSNSRSSVSVDALGKTFNGGKIEKGVQADPMTHTYDIKININNQQQQLLPGMVCNVELKVNNTPGEEKYCTVPISAVQQGADGDKFIWKEVEGKAHRQKITLGRASGNRIVVLNGLQAGEKVITEGYHKISEGTEVRE